MIDENLPLTGTVALVTGATGGIGSAIATRLAEMGASVAVNHLDAPEESRALCDLLQERSARAVPIQADVRDPDEVEKLRAEVAQVFGPVDTVVSAAGSYPRTSWSDLDPDRWKAMLDSNLTSHYLITRAFTPAMQARGGGRIITIGSVLAQVGRHDLAAYIAAKAGVEGLTRALACELGQHNITANCVAPGSIQVESERSVVTDIAAMEKRQLDRQCVKRRGKPSDVAEAVAFFARPGAGFITGQTLYVDGGWFFG